MLQGYDSVMVNPDVEFGGTDQKFNNLAGRELMAQMGMVPQDILLVPLIPGADGRKMGKTFNNTVDILTLAPEMYGKIMSMSDDVLPLYFEVLTDVPLEARIMNEEPFGPVAAIRPFDTFDSVVKEANRLDYGLAAYAYTKSAKTAAAIGSAIESGMVSINHHGLALPEVPFGGVKDSGYGSEGGADALESYLNFKFITQTGL